MPLLKYVLLVASTMCVAQAGSLLAERSTEQLSIADQLAQLRKENAEMRSSLETYRAAVMSAGGPRVEEEKKATTQETSFAEVEESADDPTIQCQTVCKFVRPAVAGN
jgi:hypothetical protein